MKVTFASENPQQGIHSLDGVNVTAIKDLQNGMKRVSVEAKVVEKGDPREVKSRFKDETYRIVDAVVADETGSVKLTLVE